MEVTYLHLNFHNFSLSKIKLNHNSIHIDAKTKPKRKSNTESSAQKKNRKILENFTSKIKGEIFPANLAILIFKQFQK
jgi:hypothetical protein